MEEAGHIGGCPGAWTHTVCRTGGEIGSNGGDRYPLYKETAFPALRYIWDSAIYCMYICTQA